MKKPRPPAEPRFVLKLLQHGAPETTVGVIKQQLAAAGKAADLPNQPKIGDAIKATQADADAVEKTLGDITTTHASLAALLVTRGEQLFSLRMNHENLQTQVNLAGKGDKAYLLTYGGVIAGNGTTTAATDDAPLNPSLKNTKISGEAHAKCKADPKAYAYAYQFGTDPTNPDGWPKPVLEPGSSYIATGLPVGQKVYCRIAVYRRGVGAGQWSPVMMLLVR